MASEEETMLQNYSKEGLESKVAVALLNSGYSCIFATDVEKIKAAMEIECEEHVKVAMHIEPAENQPESGHVLVPPAMLRRTRSYLQTCLKRMLIRLLSQLERRTC